MKNIVNLFGLFQKSDKELLKSLERISHCMDYYPNSKLSVEYLYIWSTQWWARFDHWLLICGTVHSTSPPARNLENYTLFVFMSFKEVKGKHDIEIDFPGVQRNLYCWLQFHFRHSFSFAPLFTHLSSSFSKFYPEYCFSMQNPNHSLVVSDCLRHSWEPDQTLLS